MNWQQTPGDSFEERLLTRLKAQVTERVATEEASAHSASFTRERRRGGPRLALGAAVAAIASVVAAFALTAGGENTSAAFAVEAQPEGAVRIEIRSLEDAPGLEEALSEAGIPASVNYLAAGMVCKEPRFRSIPWPDRTSAVVTGPSSGAGPFVLLVSRGTVGPGQTLVITASESLGAPDAQAEIAQGTVASCEPVPAPSGGSAANRRSGAGGG